MNPWEMNFVATEPKTQEQAVEPWTMELTESEQTKTEPTVGGHVRNVLYNVPFFGTYFDEPEAAVRSIFEPRHYSDIKKEIVQSAETAAKTPLGTAFGLGTNVGLNAAITALSRGATLLPSVSAAQGAIEGFGRGSGLADRSAKAAVGGAVGAAVPAVFNKILPTASVSKRVADKLSKIPINTSKEESKILQAIIGRAIKENKNPAEIIATGVEKGYRDQLNTNIRNAVFGESVFRRWLYDAMAKIKSIPYSDYLAKEINKVAPKYGSKIGSKMKRLGVNELGEDVVGSLDIRKLAMKAVNNVAKKLAPKTQRAITNAFEGAIAQRGVVNDVLPNLATQTAKTTSLSAGPLLFRYVKQPAAWLLNKGTMNILKPDNVLRVSEPVRSILDSLIEKPAANILND